MSIYTKFNYFLILSIPVLLITGPLLSDIAIIILFISSINLYLNNKILIREYLKKFIYIFIIFYLIGILSSSLSIDKFISLKSSIPYLRYLGFVIILYYFYNFNAEIVEKLGLVVTLIFLIFFIDSILFFLFGFNLPIDKMTNDRFSSFFGEEKVLGGFVARLFPLGLIFISSVKNKKIKKYFFVSYFLLASYLIFLSGERSAIIIYFVQLLIVIIFFPNLKKFLLTFFFSILTFIILLIYFSPNEKFSKPIERIVLHSINQIYFNNQKFSLFSTRHEDHFKTAINIFKNKFILGGGNKSFRFMCSKESYSVKKDVDERFTEYARYDDYILFVKDVTQPEKDIFYIYYKNNDKHHTKTVVNVKKLRDFINKPIYETRIKYFDANKITDKSFTNLNNTFVKKNQKLFLYDGKIYFNDGCNTHPHHIYLQVASENGIVNLLIIVSLLIYVLVQFIKVYKNKYKDKLRNKEVLLLSMIFIQILPFIPSGNFYNNWLSIFFFLPIGFYLALRDSK